MVVVFEFLDEEPIENVITYMNYKADKVVYFGYEDTIYDQQKQTEQFLKKHCGVASVSFHALPSGDLQAILNIMRREIQAELAQGNQIYFDITGGENLILVAFGMLSHEFDTPMHLYDVYEDKIIELDEGASSCLSRDVEAKKVPMSLDLMIEMHGGAINYKRTKKIHKISDPKYVEDMNKIYDVAKSHGRYWNSFSAFLAKYMPAEGDGLSVSRLAYTVLNGLNNMGNNLRPKELNAILDDLGKKGLLLNVVHENGKYRFTYKNKNVKDCLTEGGVILELHTYQEELDSGNDCLSGVFLDWDGKISDDSNDDVINEIDVLSLHGNIGTFISCKNGKMDNKTALTALYELKTVARRFGGKYAKMILVSAWPLSAVHLERAKEMGIEVR